MKTKPFKLEQFFDLYEFNVKYLMCCSDPESMSINELLSLNPELSSLEDLGKLTLGYTDCRGCPSLRETIASQIYNERTTPKGRRPIQADDVIVHTGAQEGILNFALAMLSPGDHAIVMCPGYQSSYETCVGQGCEVTEWRDFQNENLDYTEFLNESARHNTKAILVNTPHNPSGYNVTKEQQAQIIKFAEEHNILVFADEVYRYSEVEPEKNRLQSFAELSDMAISLGVMSKSFGLAGLRLGWVATQNTEVLEAMANQKHYTTICSPIVSEYLAEIALKNKDAILKRNMGIINHNLALLDQFMAKYKFIFRWKRPVGGGIGFVEVLLPGINTLDLAIDMIEKKGLMILPSSCYDEQITNMFRVGYGRANFPEVLEIFEDYTREILLPLAGNISVDK